MPDNAGSDTSHEKPPPAKRAAPADTVVQSGVPALVYDEAAAPAPPGYELLAEVGEPADQPKRLVGHRGIERLTRTVGDPGNRPANGEGGAAAVGREPADLRLAEPRENIVLAGERGQHGTRLGYS